MTALRRCEVEKSSWDLGNFSGAHKKQRKYENNQNLVVKMVKITHNVSVNMSVF